MRLIDADAVEVGFDELCQSPYFNDDVNAKYGAETLMDVCVRTDSHKPNTIDPEKLPVVRQLMEENARLRNEVMRIRKFENLPMHTIIFEMKYADFMDAGRVEELAAEVLIGLMAKDAASRHPVKEDAP